MQHESVRPAVRAVRAIYMLYFKNASPGLLVGAAVCACSLLFFLLSCGVFLYVLEFMSPQQLMAAHTELPQDSLYFPAATSTLEMHVANNGTVYLHGARVMSVSAGVLTAHLAWGSANLSWRVRAGDGTRYFDAQGEKVTLAQFRAGDAVIVSGSIDTQNGSPTVDADTVRLIR